MSNHTKHLEIKKYFITYFMSKFKQEI